MVKFFCLKELFSQKLLHNKFNALKKDTMKPGFGWVKKIF